MKEGDSGAVLRSVAIQSFLSVLIIGLFGASGQEKHPVSRCVLYHDIANH